MQAPEVTTESGGFPRIISVDDHVVEPPRLWIDRLPKRYSEIWPRTLRERVSSDGTPMYGDSQEQSFWSDVWYYEDFRLPITRIHAASGFPPEEVLNIPITFDEMRPGAFDPAARLVDMDTDGVEASLCFPNLFVRFCGQRFLDAHDRELALLCVRAYNDWVCEEWAGVSDGRLVGATIIPQWDATLSAEEVRRNAARGCPVVCFSEIPAWLGLPSLHGNEWDPFLAACSETETVIAMHIGSSSRALHTSPDAPMAVQAANCYVNSSFSLADWLTSGLFDRFPNLQLAYAEANAGWMPYLVGRLDLMWEQGNAIMGLRAALKHPPSTYFAEHVTTCVFSDPAGLGPLLHVIGADRMCFETDYPHPDSSWPNSVAHAQQQLKDVSSVDVEKVVRTNGKRLLRL